MSPTSRAARKPTAEQVQGPFYPVVKPRDRDADLTVIRGKKGKAQGLVIYVTGQVLDLQGKPIPGTQVEIWQANTFGRYLHPSDTNPAPSDPNFQGYGVQTTGAEGQYRFKTIKPGAYPVSEDWTRPPHIHFRLTSGSNLLVTQLYFAGEPLNEKDLLFKDTINKETLVAKLLPPTPDIELDARLVVWDIVLQQA